MANLREKTLLKTAAVIMTALFALPVLAAPSAPIEVSQTASPAGDTAALQQAYLLRSDLHAVFAEDGAGNAVMRKAGLLTLEDWARKYGYKELPELLASYAPYALPPALQPIAGVVAPKLHAGAQFDFSRITASSVYVIDVASRATLMSRAATKPHPLASISKLMTALVVLDQDVSMSRRYSIVPADEVGGARLNVAKGDALSGLELLNVTLLASANNTANAIARVTGLPKPSFIDAMNAKARALGLLHTTFVDPTGIEVGNMSTAQEIAALGLTAFDRDPIRRATTTSKYVVTLAAGTHTLKNTDGILNDETNGIIVMGGKTGYIEESKWNLVVKMRDSHMHPIEVVVLGSDTQAQSFKDGEAVGRWIWANYQWK